MLLPSLVKREFPEQAGLMTSVYTTSLGISAAFAAGVSVPLAQLAGIGWRGALAVWAVPASSPVWPGCPNSAVPIFLLSRLPGLPGVRDLWRSPLAWQVTLFMGLQSLAYYVTRRGYRRSCSRRMDAARAGWMLGLSQAVAIVTMFLAPMIAGMRPSQRSVVVVAVGTSGAAFWAFLLPFHRQHPVGRAARSRSGRPSAWRSRSSLRSPDPGHAAALSGMAQSVGYLLSAGGPVLFGVLRDVTGAWKVPLALLLTVDMPADRRLRRRPRRPRRCICPGRSRVEVDLSMGIYTTPRIIRRVVREFTAPGDPSVRGRPRRSRRLDLAVELRH